MRKALFRKTEISNFRNDIYKDVIMGKGDEYL